MQTVQRRVVVTFQTLVGEDVDFERDEQRIHIRDVLRACAPAKVWDETIEIEDVTDSEVLP